MTDVPAVDGVPARFWRLIANMSVLFQAQAFPPPTWRHDPKARTLSATFVEPGDPDRETLATIVWTWRLKRDPVDNSGD